MNKTNGETTPDKAATGKHKHTYTKALAWFDIGTVIVILNIFIFTPTIHMYPHKASKKPKVIQKRASHSSEEIQHPNLIQSKKTFSKKDPTSPLQIHFYMGYFKTFSLAMMMVETKILVGNIKYLHFH